MKYYYCPHCNMIVVPPRRLGAALSEIRKCDACGRSYKASTVPRITRREALWRLGVGSVVFAGFLAIFLGVFNGKFDDNHGLVCFVLILVGFIAGAVVMNSIFQLLGMLFTGNDHEYLDE